MCIESALITLKHDNGGPDCQQVQKVLVAPEPPQKRSRQFQILQQQTVVLKTSLVVATIAILTQQYPIIMPSFLTPELRTNMLQGTYIFQIGDWAAQFLTHCQKQNTTKKYDGKRRRQRKKKRNFKNLLQLLRTFQVDNHRFVISTILGAFWAGIVNPSVYANVETLLPGISLRLVLIKMILTCSILSTMGNFTTMMIRRFAKQSWESKSSNTPIHTIFASCITSCRNDFVNVLKDDLKLFPAYDILCYSVIPPEVRPLTNALIASAWAMYMSIASAKIGCHKKMAARTL
mmetsp:Transcript_16950/g.35843  ORF Transcript_16950/g.35843 Transcript_16950/m.35843 type:complete len:290 (-) Transcript_16950:167-1036(-)